MIEFNVTGSLDVASDPSDLPDDWFTRCKNLSTTEKGKAKTRDGSAKLNASAIGTPIWWVEEQGGNRFSFAGTQIYKDESSIETGLTSAQWAAIKYNAYNDTTQNIFALNGTDRKRIESSAAYEWGIEAPTAAPTLSAGNDTGLTGFYNAKYTYVRKVDGVTVAESNPSPSATSYIELSDQSLRVDVTASADAQVTHIRLYRTLPNGVLYYHDQDTPVGTYTHGVSQTWEDTGNYISGDSYKFTLTDATHSTEDTYTWEVDITTEADDIPSDGTDAWYGSAELAYQQYLQYFFASGSPGAPLSFEQFLTYYGGS